jgi:hypothetical protein
MERPRLRSDLVSEPVEVDGSMWVDVSDPDSGVTFRFHEVEFAVARAMNGKRDLDGLVGWARAELAIEPDVGDLRNVISTLTELGYLHAFTDPFAGGSGFDISDEQPTNVADEPGTPPREVEVSDGPRQPFKLDPRAARMAVKRSRSVPVAEMPVVVVMDADDDPTTRPTAKGIPALVVALARQLDTGFAAAESGGARQAPPPPVAPVADVPVQRAPATTAAATTRAAGPDLDDRAIGIEASQPVSPAARHSVVKLIGIPLLLAIAAAGAVSLYLSRLEDTDRGDRRPAPISPPARPANIAPVAPIATLAVAAGRPVEVVAPRAEVVAWVVARGTEVEADAPVVKLGSFDAVDKKLAHDRQRLAIYQGAYERAVSKKLKRAKRAARKALDRKQRDIDLGTRRLAALVVLAPAAGVVEPVVAAGERVAAGATLATIAPPPELVAIVRTAHPRPLDSEVEVAPVGDASRRVRCRVLDVTDRGTRIGCPAAAPLAEGVKIELVEP